MDMAVICRERRVYFMNWRNFFKHPIVAGLIVALIVAISGSFFAFFNAKLDKIDGLGDEIRGLSERISVLEMRVNTLSNPDNSSIPNNNNPGNSNDAGKNSSIEVQPISFIVPFPSNEEVITNSWSEISDFENNSSPISTMRIQDPVAYNYDTNEEYTLNQLVEQKVLLYYTDDGEDVFFYGQFDDEGYYTGDCTTNIYEDGNLKLITSANYLRGEMLNFVKVFPTTTKAGVDVWAISDRVVEQEYSSGETWYYVRNFPYQQNFDSNNVTENDIISAQDFLSNCDVVPEGYYCGNTSSGQFNDDTGNACLVKYFDDGTVRTLYVGKIKNGDFEDTTGNAWMIGKKDIKQASYSYYKGPFVDGKSSENPQYWTESVSQDWIDKYLQDMTFNCDLLWASSD